MSSPKDKPLPGMKLQWLTTMQTKWLMHLKEYMKLVNINNIDSSSESNRLRITMATQISIFHLKKNIVCLRKHLTKISQCSNTRKGTRFQAQSRKSFIILRSSTTLNPLLFKTKLWPKRCRSSITETKLILSFLQTMARNNHICLTTKILGTQALETTPIGNSFCPS